MKKVPKNRRPYVPRIINLVLTLIVLTFFSVSSTFAQGCLTNNLNISTGFDPNTGGLIAPVTNGSSLTGHLDPRWKITFISPDASAAIAGSGFTSTGATAPAAVINTFPVSWITLAGSRWISCLNSNFYDDLGGADYNMICERKFTVCSECCLAGNTVPVTFDFQYQVDNQVAFIRIDGVDYPVATPFNRTIQLACGEHSLSIKVRNFAPFTWKDPATGINHIKCNPTGLDVSGTITTGPNALIRETSSCSAFACPPPATPGPISGPDRICQGNTEHYTETVAGTWSGSNSAITVFSSGDVKGEAAGVATITFTNTCGTKAYKQVTVDPLPVLLSLAEITGHHCEGETVTFQVMTDVPNAIIAYHFSAPGISSATTSTANTSGYFSLSIPGAVAGTYTFTLDYIENPITHCKRIVNQPVTITLCVVPNPGSVNGRDTLCPNDSAVYTSTGHGGGTWSSSPSPLLASIDPVTGMLHTTAGSGGTVTITYSITNCCGTAASYYTVYVKAASEPTVTYTGCNPACPGTPLTFNINGDPGAVVSWGWVDVDMSGLHPQPPVTLDAAGAATISVPGGASDEGMSQFVITNTFFNGCNNAGISVPVNVQWPKGEFWQDPGTICEGSCATLMFHGQPGDHIYYNTVPASGPDASVVIPTFTAPGGTLGIVTVNVCPVTTTTYQITGAMGACCTHMAPGPTVTVNVLATPSVLSFIAYPNPVCEGETVTLAATCSSCTSFEWSEPVGSTVMTTTDGYTFGATAGYYGVKVWNQFCPGGTYSELIQCKSCAENKHELYPPCRVEC